MPADPVGFCFAVDEIAIASLPLLCQCPKLFLPAALVFSTTMHFFCGRQWARLHYLIRLTSKDQRHGSVIGRDQMLEKLTASHRDLIDFDSSRTWHLADACYPAKTDLHRRTWSIFRSLLHQLQLQHPPLPQTMASYYCCFSRSVLVGTSRWDDLLTVACVEVSARLLQL